MGSVWWTIAVFVGCLGVFHAGMFLQGQDKRLWTQLDYVWLFVAALGLIPATSQTRRMIAQNMLGMATSRYEFATKEVLRSAEFERDYYAMLVQRYENPTSDREREILTASTSATEWYAKAVNKLDGFPPAQPWRELLPGIATLETTDDPMVVASVRRFKQSLTWLNECEGEYDTTKRAAGRHELEDVMVALSPWLLAAALALRMTKVTASLKGYA